MNNSYSLSVILLAGGKGSRINLEQPKQFIPLNGIPLARYSFDLLLNLAVKDFVVVCPLEYRALFTIPDKKVLFADPGKERMFSVMNGLNALKEPVDFILTHDAARPFLQLDDVTRVLKEACAVGAASLASPISSTIKRTDTQQFVIETLPRHALWDIQTPQVLKYSVLKEGLTKLIQEELYVTDEMSVAEMMHHPVKLVQGSSHNFKVTTMKDLLFAKMLMSQETSSL